MTAPKATAKFEIRSSQIQKIAKPASPIVIDLADVELCTDEDDNKLADARWSCECCTFVNDPDALGCKMCETMVGFFLSSLTKIPTRSAYLVVLCFIQRNIPTEIIDEQELLVTVSVRPFGLHCISFSIKKPFLVGVYVCCAEPRKTTSRGQPYLWTDERAMYCRHIVVCRTVLISIL